MWIKHGYLGQLPITQRINIMEKKEIYVGGLAVIEGVMMRGPDKLATAIRRNVGTF